MKCPHCNKEFEGPHGIYRHAECYGGGRYHVVSSCCGKPVEVRSSVRVAIEVIGKGIDSETEAWR